MCKLMDDLDKKMILVFQFISHYLSDAIMFQIFSNNASDEFNFIVWCTPFRGHFGEIGGEKKNEQCRLLVLRTLI